MNRLTLVGFLIIIVVLLISIVWYATSFTQKPTVKISPTPTMATTPEPTSKPSVTADISAKQVYSGEGLNSDDYILINGSVTNGSPNTVYNVGFNITEYARDAFDRYGFVINMTVPATSGTYSQTTKDYILNAPLTTLNPNQTVSFNIIIYPLGYNQDMLLYDPNASLVWSDAP